MGHNRSVFAGMSTAYVINQLLHALSCAYIELWMHLGSLESTSLVPSFSHNRNMFTLTIIIVTKARPTLGP